MPIFHGTGVAVITPFNANNEVDYDAFGNIIEFLISSRVNALCICGTTGEPSTMSDEERYSVIDFAVKKVNKRLPVIVGCGCNSTRKTVENAIKSASLGADALLVVTPYYNKCTQDGLVAHYGSVAESTNLPVIMYNVPSRTGVNILPETAIKIAKRYKNVTAIKEASGNIDQLQKLCAMSDNVLDVYLGEDALTFAGMTLGAEGVISVAANCAPEHMNAIINNYDKGDIVAARKAQFAVNPLIKALFCEVNPIPAKMAMSMLGFCLPSPRLPLTVMTDSNADVLKAEMTALGLIK